MLIVRRVRIGKGLQRKAILAGILLGVPNYFSIHYLILLLKQHGFLQSSAAIPVVNIGVMLTSTLAAILLLREKLGRTRVLGLLLSIIALLLIALSDRRHG
jgi:drug/metabolite transporter (DMT)-like permease